MTLQTSGAISLLNLEDEFASTPSATGINLSDYYAGAASGYVPSGTIGYPGGVATAIPSSGTISLANFYGASGVFLQGVFFGGASYSDSGKYSDIKEFLFNSESLSSLFISVPYLIGHSPVGSAVTNSYLFGTNFWTDQTTTGNVSRYNFSGQVLTACAAFPQFTVTAASTASTSSHIWLSTPVGYFKYSLSTETYTTESTASAYNHTVSVQSADSAYFCGGYDDNVKTVGRFTTIVKLNMATGAFATTSMNQSALTYNPGLGVSNTTEGLVLIGGAYLATYSWMDKIDYTTDTLVNILVSSDTTAHPNGSGKPLRTYTHAYFAQKSYNNQDPGSSNMSKIDISTYSIATLTAIFNDTPVRHARVGATSTIY